MTQRQNTCCEFNSSRASIEVTEVTLQCCNRDLHRIIAEQTVVGTCFDLIIDLRALTVGIDVTQFGRSDSCLTDSRFNCPHQAGIVLFVGAAITAGTESDHFRIDFRTTANSVIVVFDNKSCSTFTQNCTIAITIEWTTGTFGIFIA